MHFRILLFLLCCLAYSESIEAQESRKGELYFFWGWNWDGYTKSDLHFYGEDYDFTLRDVVGKDRQSDFDLELYFSPVKFTIPQYNFRLGYFINDRYDISFGIDHMKYVMQNGQTVKINGNIQIAGNPYSNNYEDEPILLSHDFLQFEHTDGLNFIHFGLRRNGKLFEYKNFQLSHLEGVELGAIVPKTNTKLLGMVEYDEFHLSGYGMGIVGGLNFKFYNRFFVQSEFKGGFMDLPKVKTTINENDLAEHHFFYAQLNILFGMSFQRSK